MSRLIDEEKVIAIINERIRILKMQKGQAEKECRGGFDLRIAEAMLIKECIEPLLTAYDMERVVEELEEASIMDDIDDVFYIRESKAIDIVKRGGVE